MSNVSGCLGINHATTPNLDDGGGRTQFSWYQPRKLKNTSVFIPPQFQTYLSFIPKLAQYFKYLKFKVAQISTFKDIYQTRRVSEIGSTQRSILQRTQHIFSSVNKSEVEFSEQQRSKSSYILKILPTHATNKFLSAAKYSDIKIFLPDTNDIFRKKLQNCMKIIINHRRLEMFYSFYR